MWFVLQQVFPQHYFVVMVTKITICCRLWQNTDCFFPMGIEQWSIVSFSPIHPPQPPPHVPLCLFTLRHHIFPFAPIMINHLRLQTELQFIIGFSYSCVCSTCKCTVSESTSVPDAQIERLSKWKAANICWTEVGGCLFVIGGVPSFMLVHTRENLLLCYLPSYSTASWLCRVWV